MAEIDTKTVLDKMRSLGHDYGPDVQVYKTQLQEDKCVVFNRKGMRRLVYARDVVRHLSPEGGMSMTQDQAPEWDEAFAAEKAADGEPKIARCYCNVVVAEPEPVEAEVERGF